MIEKGRCDKGFIWNPSICECECDKSCDNGEYLKYESCKYRKKLVDKLVEECSENIDGNDLIYNGTLNDYEKVCNFCTLCIVFFSIAFLIVIGISSAFIYFHGYLEKNTNVDTSTNINIKTETIIC